MLPAVATIGGVLIVIEPVVGDLGQVAAAEDQLAETDEHVRLQNAVPVIASKELFPWCDIALLVGGKRHFGWLID